MTIRVSWLLTLSALLLSACYGGGSGAALPAADSVRTRHFALRVLDSGIPAEDQPARLYLTETPGPGTVEVGVEAEGAQGLKALYLELTYDEREYEPLAAEAAEALARQQPLQLAVLGEPGIVYYGAVLPSWDRRAGISGNVRLATLRFRKRQSDSPAEPGGKLAAAAPTSAASGNVGLEFYSPGIGTSQFEWFYTNQGDYNQDGLVGVTDLTPLGLHFGETGFFDPVSALWVIDGDGNGEIGISDITPIGANFGSSGLGGYNLYMELDLADYPAENDAVSTIGADQHLEFGAATGDPTADRLRMYAEAAVPFGMRYAWVRPVDGDGQEGTPSQWVLLDDSIRPVLQLETPAESGTGALDDPFVLDVTTPYQLILTYPPIGDVTTDSGTEYEVTSLSPEDPGSVDPATGILDVPDGYTGLFGVLASYGGVNAFPPLICRVPDPDNTPPVASFTMEPTAERAPMDLILDASPSSDPDGMIWLVQWDLNGDGVFNPGDLERLEYKQVKYGGSYEITLRVIDDDGDTDTSTQVFETDGWQLRTLDDAGDTGHEPSLAVIDGRPAIAYVADSGNLNYVRAADATGDEWNEPVTIPNAYTASELTMQEVDGGPAIVFRRSWDGDNGIKYAYSSDAGGAGWEPLEGVSSGEYDHSPTLAVVGGQPAVGYAWYVGPPGFAYTLLYHRAVTTTGTGPGAWDSFPALLFSATTLKLDKHSLVVLDGKPAVTFISNADELGESWQIRLLRASNAFGTAWEAPVSVSPPTWIAEKSHLATAVVADRLHVAWFNDIDGTGSHRRAEDAAASSWSTVYGITDVDVLSQGGWYMTMTSLNGFPALCHYDAYPDELRFIHNTEPTVGGGWAEGEVVANVGTWATTLPFNGYVSMAEVDGRPAIAYYDGADHNLVYASFYQAHR